MKIKYIFTCFLFSLLTFFNIGISFALEKKENNKLEIKNDEYLQNLQKEKLIPLGNYIYDPMPSVSEQEITESLCTRSFK